MATPAGRPPAKTLERWQRELLDAIEQELATAHNRPCTITVHFDGSRAFQILVGRPAKRISRDER